MCVCYKINKTILIENKRHTLQLNLLHRFWLIECLQVWMFASTMSSNSCSDGWSIMLPIAVDNMASKQAHNSHISVVFHAGCVSAPRSADLLVPSSQVISSLLAKCLVCEHSLHSGMLKWPLWPCSLDVEVDVDELNPEQVMELNKMATPYGMAEGDFVWSVCCWHFI